MGDKLKELEAENGRADLGHIEEGDTVKVSYRRFVHDEPDVFVDIEDEERTLRFTVSK